MGGASNCEACRDTFELDREEPPCRTCDRPTYLLKENSTAWNLWRILAGFNRPLLSGMNGAQRLTLLATDILRVCEPYEATLEDFEKILSLESALFPLLQAQWEQAAPPSEENAE